MNQPIPPNNQTKIMSPISIDRIQSTSLYFHEGTSDKEYHAAIEPKAGGFIVTFAYGRRGNTLTVGTKAEAPVSLAEANKIFDKLVASKIAKGYRAFEGSYTPSKQTGSEGNDSGIRCQLLTSVDSTELERLLNDIHYCLQEKHDGRRLMVRKQGRNEIIGINRRGLVVAIPEPIREAVARIPFDVLIDGEAVGEVVECSYLYALLQSGSIYQPVYIGKRCDIPASECTTDQIKYKSGVSSDEAAA